MNADVPSPVITDAPLTMGQIGGMLRRRWRMSLLTTVLIVMVGAVMLARITPLYEATCTLMVTTQAPEALIKTSDGQSKIELADINTQSDILISSPVLDKVIEVSDLRGGPAYHGDNAREVLANRVHVTVGQDSNTILVSLRDESPQRAERALQALVAQYQLLRTSRMAAQNEASVVLIQRNLAKAKADVDEEDVKIQAYCTQAGILPVKIMFDNGGDSYLTQQKQDLQKALIDCNVQLAPSQTQVTEILASEATSTPEHRLDDLRLIGAISHDPTVDAVNRELQVLETQQSTLAAEYGPKYPPLIAVTDALTVKRQHLNDAILTARQQIFSTHQRYLDLSKNLSKQIEAQDAMLKDYGEKTAVITRMKRELLVRQELVEKLLTSLAEVQIDGQQGDLPVTIVNPPQAGTRPVNLKWSIFGAALLLVAVTGGMLTGLAMDSMDGRLRGGETVTSLIGLPVVSEIPHLDEPPTLTRMDRIPTYFSEAFSILRAAIRAQRPQVGGLSIAVSSAMPGEGKSTVAVHLAQSLALIGARVLLIDADLRKPSLDRQFDEYTDHGLSLLLTGEDGIAPVETMQSNLDLLASGLVPPNPAELLHSPVFGQQMELWRRTYDYIVVDTPPALLFADAMLIAEHTDGILLVVRDRITSKRSLKQVLSRITLLKRRIVGVVLNDGERSRESIIGDSYYRVQLPRRAPREPQRSDPSVSVPAHLQTSP